VAAGDLVKSSDPAFVGSEPEKSKHLTQWIFAVKKNSKATPKLPLSAQGILVLRARREKGILIVLR
jgi:hypothetical protein